MKKTPNISGFSIIEVLVGIFIFTLGLISIYLIMVSSLQLNDYNKNQIIASNLAREQIELLRNVRDSNYTTLHSWDSIPGSSDKLVAGSYYKIQNDFGAVNPVKIQLLWAGPSGTNPIPEGESELPPSGGMVDYRLCLNASNTYTFDCLGNQPTSFYRYLLVEDSGISNALKITSKVIWYKRGYHDIEMSTILADWKRL